MPKIKVSICPKIIASYPEVAVGCIVIKDLNNVVTTATIPSNYIESGINKNEITLQNLVNHPTISAWRDLYKASNVKPKTYKSSIESLLRRVIEHKYNSISPVVDLYNYISAANILSIGGYDFDMLQGNLTLRYAEPSDKFTPLSGKLDVILSKEHIVYTDNALNDNVVCWMWNHKDCRRTMLTSSTVTGLFIVDCLTSFDSSRLENAFNDFNTFFSNAGAEIVFKSVLNSEENIVQW